MSPYIFFPVFRNNNNQTTEQLVIRAIKSLGEAKGSSVTSIYKWISANSTNTNEKAVKLAVEKMRKKGETVRKGNKNSAQYRLRD